MHEATIRTRHLKYYLQLSEQAEAALRGPSQIEWTARLIDERDNIRAALAWADKTDAEAGMYMCGRLERLWESFDLREGNYWLSTFLQKPEAHDYPRARAIALHTHIVVLNLLDQTEDMSSIMKEYLEKHGAVEDRSVGVDVLLMGAWEISDAAQKMELLQKAMNSAKASGDIWRQARILHSLAWNHNGDKRLDYLAQATRLFRQAGDWRSLAEVLSNIGESALLNDNFELAQKSLEEAVVLNDQTKDKKVQANILSAYGRMAMLLGEYDQAHKNLDDDLKIMEEVGYRLGTLFCRTHIGYLSLRENNLVEARLIFSEVIQNFHKDQNTIGVVFALEGMAQFYVALNKPDTAARMIGWADITREKINDTRPRLEQADVDQVIAACKAQMGEAAFSNTYDEGQKLTMDEAVALVRKEI